MDIANVLVGTKQERIGPLPSDANMEHLRGKVSECVAADRPIEMLTIWGSIKGYGIFPTLGAADLLDFMAIRRMKDIGDNVRSLHPPGVRYTILWEDTTEKILTGHDGSRYHDTFLSMLGDTARVVKESERIAQSDYPLQVFTVADIIREGKAGEIGWRGEIDWEFYVERARTEYPHATDQQLKERVSLYLACALCRYQHDVPPQHDLKFGFCPYPPTAPDALRRGRLEYKVKPSKNSHRTAAPWANFGLWRGGDWGAVSVRDLRRHDYTTTNILVDGTTVPCLSPLEHR